MAVTKVPWPREASLPCRLPPPASSWQTDSLGVLCQSLTGCPTAEQGLGETLQNRRVKGYALLCWTLTSYRLKAVLKADGTILSRPELAQLPQLFLVYHILQSSITSMVLLNSPNPTSTNLALGNPKLDKVFQMWPNQSWVKGYNTLPWPAGYTPVDTAWWAGL